MDPDLLYAELHVGWRDELFDATPRLQAGAEVGTGPWGLELNGGVRIGGGDSGGHVAARELEDNDGSWLVLRDDLVTGGLLAVWRPWSEARIGPALAVGGEVASTREITFDDNDPDWIADRSDPFLTGWFMWRAGVEGHVGPVGARLTLGQRVSPLPRPEMRGGPEDVVLADVWRLGIDVLVRVR